MHASPCVCAFPRGRPASLPAAPGHTSIAPYQLLLPATCGHNQGPVDLLSISRTSRLPRPLLSMLAQTYSQPPFDQLPSPGPCCTYVAHLSNSPSTSACHRQPAHPCSSLVRLGVWLVLAPVWPPCTATFAWPLLNRLKLAL